MLGKVRKYPKCGTPYLQRNCGVNDMFVTFRIENFCYITFRYTVDIKNFAQKG